MKQNKIIKIFLMVLIIVLISIISFGGIYIENKGTMENLVPEYLLAKDLKGYRRVEIKLSDETKVVNLDENGKVIDSSDTTTNVATTQEESVNKKEDLNIENYTKAKNVIEKRLINAKSNNYEIRQNTENGTMVVELEENDDTDRIVAVIGQQASFEMVDSETNEVLLTNADIMSSESGYTTTSAGAPVIIININFNKEGTEKFKEITKKYTESKEITSDSNGTESEENKAKEVVLKLDGQTLITTHFDKEITNGIMQLTMSVQNNATAEDIQKQLVEANSLSSVLDSGNLPLIYQVNQNKFIYSDINTNIIKIVTVVMIALVVIGTIYLAIKYKTKGVLAGISLIGYIAMLLLLVRYTNVEVSIGGLALMIFSVLLNYVFVNYMLKKENVMETIKDFALILIPALIISIVFTLTNIGIGAMLFWVIVITLLYNLVITKTIIK